MRRSGKSEAVKCTAVEMKVGMADGADGKLLLRPGRLARITIEVAEKLHEAVLAEIRLQDIGKGIVVWLRGGRIVIRLRDKEGNLLIRVFVVDVPQPAPAAFAQLQLGDVGKCELVPDGGVLVLQMMQRSARRIFHALEKHRGRLGCKMRNEAHKGSIALVPKE